LALADIVRAIREEGLAERDAVAAQAAATCERLAAEGAAQVRALEEEHEGALLGALERETRAADAEADDEVARLLRDAHEEVFQTCRRVLDERLAALRDRGGFAALCRALLEEAIEALPTAVVVEVDERDEEVFAGLIRERPGLTLATTLRTAGGVVVDDRSGRRVDNTLESRARAAERQLRHSAAAVLDRRGAGV
jgi:V/A-type H+-transporting ATPase subunit E